MKEWVIQMRKSFPLLDSFGIQFVYVPLALTSAVILASCGTGFATQIVGHPMDPLAAEEVSAVIKALGSMRRSSV